MSLSRYRHLRRFGKTPEPNGGAAATNGHSIFVVQLHHASHRHYDFRLQVGDVLKSWAVPKGPSFDPSVKRLAMEVEDHPLDYAGFEGSIPEGNYGAGDVMIFDHGTWSTDQDIGKQLAKGHLHFSLHGEKLRGEWDLVRTGRNGKKPSWLLRKVADDEAGNFESDDLIGDPEDRIRSKRVWHSNRTEKKRVATDRAFAPELCHLVDAPPSGSEWLHEPKLDGYRLLATCSDGDVRLWSRNAIEWTARVPEIANAIAALGADSLQLDGELVAVEHKGKRPVSFNALQAKLSGDTKADLRYIVFDILSVNGVDFSTHPLRERKRALHALLERAKSPLLQESKYEEGDGAKLLSAALAAGHEGLVSKRAESTYLAGRGDDWRKCRPRASEELVVVGWTDPRGARVGVGALAVARRNAADKWEYAGMVGAGLHAKVLHQLATALPKLARKTPPVTEKSMASAERDLRKVHWVEPRFVVEVEHHSKSTMGLLRQPSVKALRLDKTAKEVDEAGDRGVGVKVTNGDRVVFAETGYTKADVFAYYTEVAPLLLPEIAKRPLSLVRCPDGVAGQCFFQKHMGRGLGKDVKGAPIADSHGKVEDHVYVDDETGLLRLIQMNTIEVHPWGTHIDDPDRCDRIVFDLDPADDVSWADVVSAAELMHDILDKAKLESYLRTSGGKGLHVVVPILPTPWDEAKEFARQFAVVLESAQPDRFVSVMTKAKRHGKIFIDYLRNGRGATSVASYSLRRKPKATVALPISWRELRKLSGPQTFDLKSAITYLRKRKRDPWQGIDDVKQRLPKLK